MSHLKYCCKLVKSDNIWRALIKTKLHTVWSALSKEYSKCCSNCSNKQRVSNTCLFPGNLHPDIHHQQIPSKALPPLLKHFITCKPERGTGKTVWMTMQAVQCGFSVLPSTNLESCCNSAIHGAINKIRTLSDKNENYGTLRCKTTNNQTSALIFAQS